MSCWPDTPWPKPNGYRPPWGASAAETTEGLSTKYPGDAGIGRDPAVLFAENFETGDTGKWDDLKKPVEVVTVAANSGKYCVQMEMTRGRNTGGDLKKWFMPGADTVFARFYVKFSADYQYCHHFVWLSAN